MIERGARHLPPPDVDAYFVWPRGGNSGDDLIRRGCLKFLNAEGLHVWESDGTIEAAALAGDDPYLDAALGSFRGFIFFTGGGNIGLYPDNGQIRARVSSRARVSRGILLFSQSARAVEDNLRSDRISVWARDQGSYDLLRHAGVRTTLVPDCAFNLDGEFPKAPSGSGVFQILREPGRDDERVLHGLRLPDTVRADLTFEQPMDGVIESLLLRRVVVSDRLHGAIVALMMRKRTALLPINYHKNKSFVATWLSSVPGVAFIDNQPDLDRFVEGCETPDLDLEELFLRHARPAFRSFLDDSSRRKHAGARTARQPEPPAGGPPRLVSITCVRNEADIIEAFVRHTAAFVDEMILMDDGSSDETRRIVDQLKAEGLPLVVWSNDSIGYWQSDRMTGLMRHAAVDCGADWVLPLDADEFLIAGDNLTLRNRLQTLSTPAHVRWLTYVPHSSDDPLDPNPATRIQQRASDEDPWYKIFVPRSIAEDPAAVLQQGSHDVRLAGGGTVVSTVLDGVLLAHLPIRTPSQLAAKVAIAHLQFMAMHDRNPGWGFHIQRLYDLLKSDEANFQASYAAFALDYAPHPDARRQARPVRSPLRYAGSPLRYTAALPPRTALRLVLDYAEQLATSYAALTRERLQHESMTEAARRTEGELENIKRERAYRMAAWARAAWHLTRSVARADFADARRRLDVLRNSPRA